MSKAFLTSFSNVLLLGLWCSHARAQTSGDAVPSGDGAFGSRRWTLALGAGAVGATNGYVGEPPGTLLVYSRDDGRYSYTELSNFSPGLGVRVNVGGFCHQILRGWSLRLALGYERVHYDADFTFPDGFYQRSSASSEHYGLDFRFIFDRFRVKPYISFVPAFTHLGLPRQKWLQDRNGSYNSGMVDTWMSGTSLGASLGAMIELVPSLAVDGNLGLRRDRYSRDSDGSFSPHVGLGQSFVLGIGLEWWPL